jgi:hypothetical protein
MVKHLAAERLDAEERAHRCQQAAGMVSPA